MVEGFGSSASSQRSLKFKLAKVGGGGGNPSSKSVKKASPNPKKPKSDVFAA